MNKNGYTFILVGDYSGYRTSPRTVWVRDNDLPHKRPFRWLKGPGVEDIASEIVESLHLSKEDVAHKFTFASLDSNKPGSIEKALRLTGERTPHDSPMTEHGFMGALYRTAGKGQQQPKKQL